MILSTLLYDGNAQQLLSDNGWFLSWRSPVIRKKLIIVNNCDVSKWGGRLQELSLYNSANENNCIEYFFADDYRHEVNPYFKIDISEEKTVGYRYILPYFALLLYLKDEFIFHVSDDCMEDICVKDDYLLHSIDKLTNDENCISTSINWGNPGQSFGYDVGEWEELEMMKIKGDYENKKRGFFWHTPAFSDQLWLSSVKKLKEIDYTLPKLNPFNHPPQYCPFPWETRVSSWMWKTGKYRAVYKDNVQRFHHKVK